MLDNTLIGRVKELSESELVELYRLVRELLPNVPLVTYQQRRAKCGCKQCRHGGQGHGLYWYAFFRYGDKTYCVYVGKEKKEINPLEVIEGRKRRKAKKSKSKKGGK